MRTRVVGRPYPKVDAAAKVTGLTKFADDLDLPRMLHCKILRSKVAHARLRRVDASAALARPGVVAVATGADLPIAFGILPVSQDEHALAVDRVRFVGDAVAAVAAIDEDSAFDALEAIVVEYEPLPPIGSIDEAIARPEPRIHDYGDRGNFHKLVSMEFGETERGFAEADRLYEDLFFYEGSTHLPLEQHAADLAARTHPLRTRCLQLRPSARRHSARPREQTSRRTGRWRRARHSSRPASAEDTGASGRGGSGYGDTRARGRRDRPDWRP